MLGEGSEPPPSRSLTNRPISLASTSVVPCVSVRDGTSDRTGWGLQRRSAGTDGPVKPDQHSTISRIMLNRHYAALNQQSTNANEYGPIAAEAVFAASGIEQNDVGRVALILQTRAEHCNGETAGSGIA